MGYTFNISEKIHRLGLGLSFAALLALFGGCSGSIYSNYRDVEQLQVVQTLGMDTYGQGVLLTVSTGQGLQDMPAVLLSRPGESIASAIRELQIYSGKDELYYSHVRFALLGQSAAEKALGDFFGYLERSTRLRPDIALFVVKDTTAKSLMSGSGEKNYEIGSVLSSIQRDSRRLSDPLAFSCREVIRSLSQYGSSLVCCVSSEKIHGTVFSESAELSAIPQGYGIIKDGALAGFITPEETACTNLLLGEGGLGPITLRDKDGQTITLGLERSSVDFSALWEGDRLSEIHVTVKAAAALEELEHSILPPDSLWIHRLASLFSEKLRLGCASVLKKSQTLGADFLGLAGQLRRSSPREMALLGDGFPEALKTARLYLTVDGSISRSYEVGNPENVGGSDNA